MEKQARKALFVADSEFAGESIAFQSELRKYFESFESVKTETEILEQLREHKPQIVFFSPNLPIEDLKQLLHLFQRKRESFALVAGVKKGAAIEHSGELLALGFDHLIFDCESEEEVKTICDRILLDFQKQVDHHQELEDYSVFAGMTVDLAAAYAEANWRAEKLDYVNSNNQAIIDHLDRLYLYIDSTGSVRGGGSGVMAEIFGKDFEKKKFWDLMARSEQDAAFMQQWVEWVFASGLSFTSLVRLMPEKFKYDAKTYRLDYRMINSGESEKQRKGIVLIFEDQSEHLAEERSKSRDQMQMKMAFRYFIEKQEFETEIDFLRSLMHELETALEKNEVKPIGNFLTGIKGSLLSVYMIDPINMVDAMRVNWIKGKFFEDAEANRPLCESLTKEYEKIQLAINTLVSELSKLDRGAVNESSMNNAFSNFLVLSEMFKRMLPRKSRVLQYYDRIFVEDGFAPRLNRFRKIIQEMAKEADKPIHYYVFCEDIVVPMSIYEPLVNTFQRAFRNIVVHGIEKREKREASEKPMMGKIYVIVDRQLRGDIEYIRFRIIDDGAGIDPDIVRKLAVERGIYAEEKAKYTPEEEIIQLVIDGRFSSKQKVDGKESLGMDSIVTEAGKIGGNVQMFSQKGEGTEMHITVPLFRSFAALKAWTDLAKEDNDGDIGQTVPKNSNEKPSAELEAMPDVEDQPIGKAAESETTEPEKTEAEAAASEEPEGEVAGEDSAEAGNESEPEGTTDESPAEQVLSAVESGSGPAVEGQSSAAAEAEDSGAAKNEQEPQTNTEEKEKEEEAA